MGFLVPRVLLNAQFLCDRCGDAGRIIPQYGPTGYVGQSG